MKVTVRIFGKIKETFNGEQGFTGIELEMPEGSTVKHLLTHLELDGVSQTMVIANGRILKQDDLLPSKSLIQIFRPVLGG